MRTVREVMTTGLVVAQDATPFKQAVDLMQAGGISALPIVDGDDRPIGIVSEADLLQKQAAQEAHAPWNDGRKARALTAGEAMTSPAITVSEDASLAEAAQLMHKRGVKRLVVVDDSGKVVGIVSRKDVLSVFARPDRDIARDVTHDVIERTLGMEPMEAGVAVRVSKGIVTLEGTVDHRSTIRNLIGHAWQVDGVVGIENELGYRIDDELIPAGRIDPPGARRRSFA